MYTNRSSKLMVLTISTLTAFSAMLTACGDANKTTSPQVAPTQVESCMLNLPKVRGRVISEEELKNKTGKLTAQEIHFAMDRKSSKTAASGGGSYILDNNKNTYKTSHCFGVAGELPEDYESIEHTIPIDYTLQSKGLK